MLRGATRLRYNSPLMATLSSDALIVAAAADMTVPRRDALQKTPFEANFNLTSSGQSPQKYILQLLGGTYRSVYI